MSFFLVQETIWHIMFDFQDLILFFVFCFASTGILRSPEQGLNASKLKGQAEKGREPQVSNEFDINIIWINLSNEPDIKYYLDKFK